ncbi:MAG TPA: hypothetical protein VFZ77_13740 [Acidimicrobiales bacterium]
MTRDDEDRTPIDQVVSQVADLFVYAPIGLFFEGPSLLPKLAEQGRVHARNARLFGQFAVRHGEAEIRRRVGDLEAQAGDLLRRFGLVIEPEQAPPPAPPAPQPPPVFDEAASGNGQAPPAPAVADLAITDYDSLSASQVVTRLEGLTPDELEAVRAYEMAHRGRKTILNKVAQLQG